VGISGARPEATVMFVLYHAGKPDVVITEDEEYKRVNFDKFKKLSTVFQVCTSLPFSTVRIIRICLCVFLGLYQLLKN
jgi:hypothetical protein